MTVSNSSPGFHCYIFAEAISDSVGSYIFRTSLSFEGEGTLDLGEDEGYVQFVIVKAVLCLSLRSAIVDVEAGDLFSLDAPVAVSEEFAKTAGESRSSSARIEGSVNAGGHGGVGIIGGGSEEEQNNEEKRLVRSYERSTIGPNFSNSERPYWTLSPLGEYLLCKWDNKEIAKVLVRALDEVGEESQAPGYSYWIRVRPRDIRVDYVPESWITRLRNFGPSGLIEPGAKKFMQKELARQIKAYVRG